MNLLFLLAFYVVCSVSGHHDIPTTLVGPCHGLSNGVFARDVTDCANWYHCANGATTRGRCADNQLFDYVNQQCNYIEDVTCFSCPRDKLFAKLPVERTCHQYYQCWMGNPTVHSCPGELVFDAKLGRCNFPIGTGCDGDEQVEERCPAVDGDEPVYLRHATSCNLYYVCQRGTPIEHSCLQGLHFNPLIRDCDIPANANCQIPGGDEGGDGGEGGGGGEGGDESGEGGEMDQPAIPCPDTGYVFRPHKDNCNAYFVCIDGEATMLQHCAPGVHFDYERGQCDRPIHAKCWSRENPPLPPSRY